MRVADVPEGLILSGRQSDGIRRIGRKQHLHEGEEGIPATLRDEPNTRLQGETVDGRGKAPGGP